MTTNALTAADYAVLTQYANAGQRELYWQYLELKGDIYAKRAGEVVRNDGLSAQIANQHAESYAPEGFGGEARWDDFGVTLMQKDLAAREKRFNDATVTDGGLILPVDTIRTYHADNFQQYGMSQSAWTLEAIIGPLISSGDPAQMATAQRIWNDAMGYGLDYVVAAIESSAYSFVNGNPAWLFETAAFTLGYDANNNKSNPNHIRGFEYNSTTGKWYKNGGRTPISATGEETIQLNLDRQWRIGRLNNSERFRKAVSDTVNPAQYNPFPKDPDRFGTVPNGTIDNIKDYFTTSLRTVDPLILDLDGDGVETTSISQTNTYFDHDGNGFAQKTAWVGKDDGLLVLDRNGNGTIDNGLELFGNSTKLANGQNAADGFAALADLDSNNDGKIDNNDTQYNNLRIWQDKNSNGITDAGELISLATAGVKSLNVNYNTSQTATIDANGNQHTHQGQYTTTDGAIRSMEDILLNQDTARTIALTVSPEVADTLSLYNPSTGQGNITKQWLNDRDEMQHWVKLYGAQGAEFTERFSVPNELGDTAFLAGDYIYKDLATGLTLDIDGFNPTTLQSQTILFGGASNAKYKEVA